MKKIFLKISILFLTSFLPFPAMAGVETTGTIPKGVYSPEFIFGSVYGLGQKFDSSGNIVGVADQYQMDLTGAKIAKLNSDGASLVQALNAVAPGFGDNLVMGSVEFKANPAIDYFVINPAYGIKNNMAVGFAIPYVHFQNQMHIVASSGNENIVAKQAHTGGIASGDFKDGIAKAATMASDLPGNVQRALAEKGYLPIGNVDIKTFGDAQIYFRYRYFENKHWRLAARPYIVLPTGRPDNPDDLGDISIGGYWGGGLYLAQEYQWNKYFESGLILQYEGHLPTVVTKRVPRNQDDILPGLDQKQGVNYSPGNISDTLLVGRYTPTRWLLFGAFYGITFKDPDWYDGDQHNYDYAYLSQDTGYRAQRVGGYIEFKTTDFYFERKFSVPLIVGYTFSNTILAVNSPQSISHIFNLRMFF